MGLATNKRAASFNREPAEHTEKTERGGGMTAEVLETLF
jgi:hypothetical protein